MAARKLLVADDSLTIQKVIRLALSNEGYDIQAVSDGNDAIQQISLFGPDVVLIDISLPTKSAFQVKEWLNQKRNEEGEFRNTAFVLMSSAFEKVNETEAERVKFDARLTKPFDPAYLRKMLHELLEERHPTKVDIPASFSAPLTTPPPLPPAGSVALPSISTMPPLPEFELDSPQGLPHVQLDQESDIKRLTESTIRMSGLDEFQWSVNEPIKAPPQPSMPELPTTPPPMSEDFESSLPELPSGLPPSFEASIAMESVSFPPPPFSSGPPPAFKEMDFSAITPAVAPSAGPDLETATKEQLEAQIEKLARKLLPEIAERVIREEIHRLLNDQHR